MRVNKKEEQYESKNIESLKEHYSKVLELIGEDPSREGLIKTPERVAVVMEARHLCMQIRGVEKQSSITTTSAFSGAFLESEKTRLEFINLIR